MEGVELDGAEEGVEIIGGGGVAAAVGEGGVGDLRSTEVDSLLSIGFRFALEGARHLTTTE